VSGLYKSFIHHSFSDEQEIAAVSSVAYDHWWRVKMFALLEAALFTRQR